MYRPAGGVYTAAYVSARCPRVVPGASRTVFMCRDEIERRLPPPGPAAPVGGRSRRTSIRLAVTLSLAPGEPVPFRWVSYGLLT